MVRTSVQNILLSLMKIDNPTLQKFFSRFPFILYFANYACFMKDTWKKMDDIILENDQQSKFKEMLDDQIDTILTLQDILQINMNPQINNNLFNSLMSYAIIPGVIGSFTQSKKGQTSINMALYLLILFFTHFTNKEILNFLTLILFAPETSDQLQMIISKPSKPPHSHKETFSSHEKDFWDDYPEMMQVQQEAIFEKGQIQYDEQDEPDERPILIDPSQITIWDGGKCEKELQKISRAFGFSVVGNVCSQEELKFSNIFQLFQFWLKDLDIDLENQVKEQQNENKYKFEGGKQSFIACGDENLFEDINQKQPVIDQNSIDLLSGEEFKNDDLQNDEKNDMISPIKQDPEPQKTKILTYQKNQLREILLSFLITKDDYLILMTSTLIQKITQNKYISKEVLIHCGLLADKSCQSEQNYQSIQTILSLLIKHLTIDPPFRICTYKVLSSLINQFLYDKSKDIQFFTQDQLDNFNIAYKQSIDRMMMLTKNQIVWEFLVETFELESNNFEKNNFFEYKLNILNIIFPITSDNHAIDLEYRQEPVGNREITRRDIIIFLILFKLRYRFIKKSIYPENELNNFQNVILKLQKNEILTWNIGEFYMVDLNQFKCIKCQEKKDKKLIDSIIIINNQNFTICIITDEDKKQNQNQVKVIHNKRLFNVEISPTQQKNCICVSLKDTINGKDRYKEVEIVFNNEKVCAEAKDLINQNRQLSKQINMTAIVKCIEMADNDIFTIENMI